MDVSPAAVLALAGLALLSAWRVIGDRPTEASSDHSTGPLLAALALTGALAAVFSLAWTPLLDPATCLGPVDGHGTCADGSSWYGAFGLLAFVLPVLGGITYAVRRSSLARAPMEPAAAPARRAPTAATSMVAGVSDREDEAEDGAVDDTSPEVGPSEAPADELESPAEPRPSEQAPAASPLPADDGPASVDGEPTSVEAAYARAAELLEGDSIALAFSGHASADANDLLGQLRRARAWSPFVISGGANDEAAEEASGRQAAHEQELALMVAGGALAGVLFLDGHGEFSPLMIASLGSMGSVCLHDEASEVASACRVRIRFTDEADRLRHLERLLRALGLEHAQSAETVAPSDADDADEPPPPREPVTAPEPAEPREPADP